MSDKEIVHVVALLTVHTYVISI